MICTIRSNNGWQKIQFIQQNEVSVASRKFISFHLHIHTLFWDREELLLNDEFNEVKTDKIIKYEQLVISQEKWKIFLESMEKWNREGKTFFLELSNNVGDYLSVKLEDSDHDLITSSDKPVLSLTMEDSRMRFEFKMVIDQTSLAVELVEK
jgi:hypothetical protein